MTNLDMQVDGDVLTLRIDLSKRFGDSKSGKTTIIASTGGNINVEGHPNVKIGVNVYEKK